MQIRLGGDGAGGHDPLGPSSRHKGHQAEWAKMLKPKPKEVSPGRVLTAVPVRAEA